MQALESLSDPRDGRAKRHYFGEVLFIALAAMISGMDDFENFERFAEEREDWLHEWLQLPNGLPCDDTFRRIFAALDPEAFGTCFINFTASLSQRLGQELVAIDGKTLRGSFTAADKSDALHLISAWAATSGLTLGQLLVDSKTNEINAVPGLLRQIDVKGCVVSLDAMGCQKKIAISIRHAEADYLLALKGDHGTLHGEVRDLFADPAALEAVRCREKWYPLQDRPTKVTAEWRSATSPSPIISTGLMPESAVRGSTSAAWSTSARCV